MKIIDLMLIICVIGLILASMTPIYEEKVCIQLETGSIGELKENQFCNEQACRPITVKYEVVPCNT